MADNDRDTYDAWVEYVKAQRPQPMDVFDPLDAGLLDDLMGQMNTSIRLPLVLIRVDPDLEYELYLSEHRRVTVRSWAYWDKYRDDFWLMAGAGL